MAAKVSAHGKATATCLILVMLSMLAIHANGRDLTAFTSQVTEFEAPATVTRQMPVAPALAADADAAQGSSIASAPATAAAAAAGKVVWVNRTSTDGGPCRCNVTCAATSLARYNESGWVAISSLMHLTATQKSWMGELCRRFYNKRYITGFVSKTYDPDSGEQGYGCYIAVDATKEGLAANTFECGCGRGCAMKDCGIWNRTKVCNCNSGCACGGFYPASKSEYLGYYAFGVTGKSTNATRCSVNEPLGMDDNWYYRIPTMHIRGCAGPN